MSQIKIKVKLFAIYQEVLNTSELDLSLPASTTAGDVLETLITRKPQLAKWREVTRFGVNLQFVDPATKLANGDEIVLIPPVSGG